MTEFFDIVGNDVRERLYSIGRFQTASSAGYLECLTCNHRMWPIELMHGRDHAQAVVDHCSTPEERCGFHQYAKDQGVI